MAKKKSVKPKPPSFRPVVKAGNLNEVRAWVHSKKPLYLRTSHNSSNTVSMLEVAVETGFFSMVELLLELTQWSDEALGGSLRLAAYAERVDMIDLLLDNGAPWQWADADEIFGTMNDALIRRFLDLGMRFDDEDAFFTVLSRKRARPLLRIYKQYRKEYPELEDQMAKALVDAVQDKKVRWTILLLWAGADPCRWVPYSLSGKLDDDDDYGTCAIERAYNRCDETFLDETKIENKVGDLTPFLGHLHVDKKPDILRRVLRKVDPSALNARDGDSRNLLEHAVDREFYDFGWHRSRDQEQQDLLECIRILIDAGARWDPSPDHFRGIRKGLCSYGDRHVVQVIRLLMYTPGTAPFEKIWELCRTGKIKDAIYRADDELWREMKALASERGLKGGSTRRSARSPVSRSTS